MPTIRKRKSKSKRSHSTKTILLDLPLDILLAILTQLDHTDRLTLSLVSKSVKSLIDANFIRQLKFSLPPSNSTLRKLFSRFTSVNRIALQYDHSFDEYVLGRNLVQISKSQLKIESLEVPAEIESLTPRHMDVLLKSGTLSTVKALKLYGYGCIELSDLKFTSLFPFLQELESSEQTNWEDTGIEMLALKAPNLRKINLDCNYYLTDKSLDALGNCVYLEDVSFTCCGLITLQGLSAFIHKRKNLKSLNLPFHQLEVEPFEDDDGILKLAKTISNCKNLTHISIYEGLMRDDFLTIIAKSRSALTSLTIGKLGVEGGDNYTIQGVSAVLRAYKGLTKFHVCLQCDNSATYDTKMSNLVKSLPCLKNVYIFSRFPFYETLFSLIQNCPLLEEIYLKSVDFDRTDGYEMPGVLKKNYSVQQIHLEFLLSGFFLSKIEKMAIKSSCPALKIFDCDDYSNFLPLME